MSRRRVDRPAANDEDAKCLSQQTFLLGEFRERAGYESPPVRRRTVVHGHCHHNAIFGMGSDEAVLAKLGLDFELLDAGCCGIADAFGFVKKHYNVSIACGAAADRARRR